LVVVVLVVAQPKANVAFAPPAPPQVYAQPPVVAPPKVVVQPKADVVYSPPAPPQVVAQNLQYVLHASY